MIKDNPDTRIPKEKFIRLSNEICGIFPTEQPETYYVPAYRDSRGKPISAHGKLYDRYVNTRVKYQKLELISKSSRKNKDLNPDNVTNNDVNEDEELVQEFMNWLKHNVDPFHKVVDYWRLTSKSRLKAFSNDNIEIYQYYDLYPSLKQPLGYSLLTTDFELPTVSRESQFTV
ncbi:hypothetical protein PPYR_12066 [Photinus pyralis]|uniref:Uncharacterized protein n=1 Tax=Photinus pyralis TaxID=7054 RepID=A0A5N4AD13_PHOPY|nr:uncharacterized protein LOC116177198 [Photinus pyralis]XP_031351958.1 uncharacterized protein LOC116177198 [Photinus pyralis]KAB0795227.1 hypothetical protein PPYR_12066 [Photinus pyralis]